jgi:hypothetical protein
VVDGWTAAAGSEAPVHFWTTEVEEADVAAWDPSAEPARFPSGRGHALYELFVRLRARGRPVTLGPTAPSDTHVILTALECIAYHAVGIRPREAFALARAALRVPRVVCIRINVPYSIATPRFASIDVAPNIITATGPRDRWLPLLPQRGLVARDAGRADELRTIGLKSFGINVPEYIVDGRLGATLEPMGVEVRVDTEPGDWPDFETLDAVICDRKPFPEIDGGSLAHKPPTKLVNAWCAGVVPIVAPEPAYVELAHDGWDAMFADGFEATVAAVARLCSEPELRRRLFAGVRARSAEFTTDHVLDQWEELLWRTPMEAHRAGAVAEMAALAGTEARSWVRRSGRRVRWGTKRMVKRIVAPLRPGAPPHPRP